MHHCAIINVSISNSATDSNGIIDQTQKRFSNGKYTMYENYILSYLQHLMQEKVLNHIFNNNCNMQNQEKH